MSELNFVVDHHMPSLDHGYSKKRSCTDRGGGFDSLNTS